MDHPSKTLCGKRSTRWGCGALALLLTGPPALAGYPDKGQWIRDASDTILNKFTNIDAFMWFNQYKPWLGEPDWRVGAQNVAAWNSSWGFLDQGVYLDAFPYPNPFNATAIDGFEALVNHHQARIGWYESLDKPFPAAGIQAVQARDSRPFIVFEPFDASLGDSARSGPSRLAAIELGAYDARFTEWATAAAANGQPIDIVLGHEMNGNWFTWGYLNDNGSLPADASTPGHNGNTAQMFIDAFQHVVDIFDAHGATNVNWVWSINASWHDDFSMAFPGADYVDRMGMNGFNWGGDPSDPTLDDWEKWREFEQIFGQWDPNWDPSWDPDRLWGVHNYNRLVSLAPETPIIIGEFASVPEPTTLVLLALGLLGFAVRRRRR